MEMKPIPEDSEYVVLQHGSIGELMQDVTRYARTGKWKLAGGIAVTLQILTGSGPVPTPNVQYYQALATRNVLGL